MHQRIRIFLTTNMLKCREVQHVVVLAIGFKKASYSVEPISKTKVLKITIDITIRAANISHQFDHIIFTDINNVQFFGFQRKSLWLPLDL